ncbi:trypsin-like peptidase domain-containing protein [Tunturibacter empetritectus]|uniref:Serine protease Do n=1 Tax=Tunturiibacter lichenicola TaxID=2051959 RepID=A0A7W8J9I1_9BACT|nr:trypsin-like peptidase domain-containing protein [Edaphobacter lichenicola]MBB5343797.1 serine protease Do [Edaphobacter lichenicola]
MKLAIPVASALLFLSVWLPASGQSAETTGASGDRSAILREYDQAIDEVAEHAMHSVVQIEVTGFGKPESSDDDADPTTLQRQRVIGSGVIVDPDGYIVTNNHVVAGALRIRVIVAPTTVELVTWHTQLANPQRVYEAKLIGTNRYADLAVIKIEAHDLPAIALPEPFHVRLGQTVIAIGSPQGLDHTITKGIISAVGRQPELDRPMVYVQTDAPINPGNSGGPLIDRDGNLIGINTFIYSSGGGSEGLGFAVPEPVVRFVYYELKAHGFVPSVSIGAHAQAITPDLAAGLKLTQDHGVIFSDVDMGGPAAAAGLKPGDIVEMIDGVPIDSFPKYTAFLYVHTRGAPLRMVVSRVGKQMTLSVNAVDSLPMVDSLSDLTNPKKDLIPSLGIFVVDLNDFIAAALPGLRSKRGVVVAGVLSGEPATLASLEVGDVVRAINGRPLNTTEELRQQLANFKPGDSVALEVERQSVLQYVAFEVE